MAIAEKTQNEDSSTVSSANTSFSETIIQDINYLKTKENYLITKSFENKIPELLSYLQCDSNAITNKLLIIKYLEILFTKVCFNSEIFSYKYSNDKERLNIFQIIINQYIICPNDKDDYLRELKGLFTLLLSQIKIDYDTYHYIFSFLINYLNFNGEHLSKILQLLQIYYQSIQTIEEPYNYFFFVNGESDSSINILDIDNKKLLNLNESLNILIFIKILPSQIIKQVYPKINYKIIDVFFNRNKNVSIGIDIDNCLITNFTSKPLKNLQDNKFISILVKFNFKDNIKTEIFVNNEKVDIPKDSILHEKDKKNNKEKYEIKKIKLFETFIGMCSNIIIYKEDKKNEGLPKFFTLTQTGWKGDMKDKFILKPIYLNGLYKEELFSILMKQELKKEIEEQSYKKLNFLITDKSGENDIKEFVDNNLISIYMPNRFMLPEDQINQSYKNANRLILKDSINNLDAEFITNSPYINGIHLFTKLSEDFCHFGGLNHFLPIIEMMTLNENLLLKENLLNFFNLISSVIMPSYLNALENENDSNFFFKLSLFLKRINDKYFDAQIASKLISISWFLIYLDNNYKNLIQQFHEYILMNKEIMFKFNYEEQTLILQQIKNYIDIYCNKREGFVIDIMLIINILIEYDKEKNNKFCCKNHSEYFNEKSEEYFTELEFLLKPIEEIIEKLFEKFTEEASQIRENEKKECEIGKQLYKIFELLTVDLLFPCIQKMIINQFLKYMKKHLGKYISFLDIKGDMIDIAFFIFKTSIFDVKIDAFNLILLMNTIYENNEELYSNKNRTNSWAFKNENDAINEEKKIFIQKYILPFYLLGEGILVSSKESHENSINTEDIENNDNYNMIKKTNTEKTIKAIKNINSNFIKRTNTIENNFESDLESINSNKKDNFFTIKKNGKTFKYIKITAEQQKIYLKYKTEKINNLIEGLYNSIISLFKKIIDFDFYIDLLIKLVSKGNIIIIKKFLDDLKNNSTIQTNKKTIFSNHQLFHWLFETCFQAYMIKEQKYNKDLFVPGFCINPFKEESGGKKEIFNEEEKKQKVDEIYKDTKEFIIDILKQNLFKLDNIFTWSKYYYEIRNDKNNFKKVRNFVFEILRNTYKLPYEISFSDKTIDQSSKESLYYLNLLFEFITFYKFNETNSRLIEEKFLEQNSEIIYNLLLEIDDGRKIDDIDIMKTLNIKWISFPYYSKIFTYFRPLWKVSLDKTEKEEKIQLIIKKYIGKKDSLELLFYSFEDIQEFKDKETSKIYANKGIKAIYMIFIFFILLFKVGGNKNDVLNIYSDFRQFISLLIVSPCAITSSDKKKQKWPNDSQYKEVQESVKYILCITLYYFSKKILLIENISIQKKNNEKDKELIDYYSYIRKILIEDLGYFLQLILTLRQNNGKLLSKLISSDSIIKSSGPYILSEELYSCNESNNTSNNKTNNKIDNFLDNFLSIDINRQSKEINSDIEKNVKIFIESENINKCFSKYLTEQKYTKKLFSFSEYVKKREELIESFIIPIYNNRIYTDKPQKNLCLMPDFEQDNVIYEKDLDETITKIHKKMIKKIFLNEKKIYLEENKKIKEYKTIKKKLFSFKGIWSKEEFFYENKYHLKYKLVNHLTEDFSKVLLTPILDIDNYLPIFTHFKKDNLFRYPEKQIPIYYLTDLSFPSKKSHKSFLNKKDQEISLNKTTQEDIHNTPDKINNEKKSIDKNSEANINIDDETIKINDNIKNEIKIVDNKKKSDNKKPKKRFNLLHEVKLANNSFQKEMDNPKNLKDDKIFSDFIEKNYLSNSKTDKKVDACLIKIELHICGIFYQNSEEIGFYSAERAPKGYDPDRKICFGSIFKPQINKYNNYYLKIPYNSIEFILKRRYFYKKTVLEIFTINKKSYSFRIEENELKEILENIRNYMKPDIDDIIIENTKYEDKIGFFNKNKMLTKDIFLPNIYKNMNLKKLYEKWTKWEISTLKFLMILNLYSNRSYNDINQYPVVPWIITDYSSQILSTNEKHIRQLGKPMGMLDFCDEAKERKNSYESAWKLCEKEGQNDEEFDRYRTHYSTSLYVTYYLVRIFPFSNIRIELQGSNFDDPNRLFNSLVDSFKCALTQKSDVRELVPEFFYLPEIFYNLNKLNLGNIKNRKNKTETQVNDVKMPEWANNDAYIFVSKHRKLLESPELSEKINKWFNIIFGNKQNGDAAKEIGNLFLRHTYEDFEETYDKSDEKTKLFFCRMIEFGVTPHQIFKNETNERMNYNELGTKKNLLTNITEIIEKNEEKNKNLETIKGIKVETTPTPKSINKNNNLTPIKLFIYGKSEELGKKSEIFVLNEEGIITITIFEKKQSTSRVSNIRKKSSQTVDCSLGDEKVDKKSSKKTQKNTDLINNINLVLPKYRINNKETPSVFFNKGHCIALGGFWNGNILIENISVQNKKDKNNDLHPETKIYSTKESSPITHIVIDENEIFAICGNTLGLVFVYVINENDKTIWNLYKIIYNNYSPITSIEINKTLNIFIICDKDGYCMIYTLPKCKLINSFQLKNIININNLNNLNNNESISLYANISIISSSPLPCIIFYFKTKRSLAVLSINGHLIKEQEINFDINPNSIKKFTDLQFVDYLLIYNPKSESLDIYNIIDLQKIITWPIKNYSFIDFTFSKELDIIYILTKTKTNISIKEKEKDNNNLNEYKILLLDNDKAFQELDDNKTPL